MAGDTVEKIKDKLSIQDVVSGYVKVERAGNSLRARCPFHAEKTPSFFISPERGTYHCFGCNVGGDIFSFIQAIEGTDFKGALKILAERAGVPLEFTRGEKKDDTDRLYELLETATIYYASRLGETELAYLHKRGLTDGTIATFRLGYAGDGWSDASDVLKKKNFTEKELLDAGVAKKNERGGVSDKFRNRIMFPIADSAGRVIGFSGRIFGKDASPDAPKYLNSPETTLFKKSKILYGFDKAKQSIRKHGFAVLVEGQVDLLMSHQAGWTNTVAVSGTAFTPEHATLLKRMAENLVIALDADEAGIKAAARAARSALQKGMNVKVAALPSGLDPADFILEKGAEEWRRIIREAKDIITFLLDVLEARMKDSGAFRRGVESAVIPFLADIQSPIAREQYIREIADRLHVSETAVSAFVAGLPREASTEKVTSNTRVARHEKQSQNRAREAYAIMLWQQSLSKPIPEILDLEKDFERAVGASVLAELTALSDTEKEALRFGAEKTYGTKARLADEFKSLVGIVERDRLLHELQNTGEELRVAEQAGDDGRISQLSEQCRLLTLQIAHLEKRV